MRLLLLCTIILVCSAAVALPQNLSVFDLDASQFPLMKAKFYAFDAVGQQASPSVSEITVSENGIPRTVLSVTCPPQHPVLSLSVAMSIDVSGSMSVGVTTPPVELAKTTLHELVSIIADPSSEFALQTCDQHAVILQDFTTRRDMIISGINPIRAGGGNNFVEQLINPMTGLLNIARTGNHKRVAVLCTDAFWGPLSASELQQCKDICAAYDIEFYAIIYSLSYVEPNGIKASLRALAEATGGMLYDGIISQTTAQELAWRIQQHAQAVSPCEITWQSDVSCVAGGRTASFEWNGRIARLDYVPPGIAIARFRFDPTSVYFRSKPIGQKFDTTVTITAVNASFNVTNITSSNPAYDIAPKTFSLAMGESRTLTVSYTPPDDGYTWTRFDILSDICSQSYEASGGYPGVKPRTPTLRLVEPNGGERFVAGSDTVITWTGIPATDLVRLEYSIDSGSTWNSVADTASGGIYRWHVPKTPSTACLVRVRHLLPGGDMTLTLKGHTGSVRSIAWSPDGSKVATSSDDLTVRIWDAKSGLMLRKLSPGIGAITCVAWNPGGTKIAAGGSFSPATVKIWEVSSGALIQSLAGHTNGVSSVSWSLDGGRLATAGSQDKIARIWDVTSGELLQTLDGHTGWVHSVAWSPDGSKVATASPDMTAKIWDSGTGDLLQTLTGHTNSVWCVAWSPDGSRVATASEDWTAMVWDVKTGIALKTFTGHTSAVNSVAWSRDGSRLATASDDRMAKIWDLDKGIMLRTLTGHTWYVTSVCWSPDGSRVATGSDDWTAKIWDLNADGESDLSDSLFSIVMPQPLSRDVDMGKTLVGSPRDSLIESFISNTGTYPFNVSQIRISGADASHFSLVSGIPPFDVAASSSSPVEFRFHPSSAGMKSAQLLVITQTDTLHQTITGEGIPPPLEILEDVIDFGKVDVGKPKDTLQVVTIKNIGTSSLTITATRHAGPNDRDYSTLAGGGHFVLEPGSIARLDLRFQPSDAGRTSGRLLFEYDGIGSPATVYLFGEGIRHSAQIQAVGKSFVPVACQNGRIDTVRVVNTGTDDLDVSSATIIGTNAGDFIFVQPFARTTVQPDSTAFIPVAFTPQGIGDRTATLELRSNSLTDSILAITLSGRKESTDFMLNLTAIDLGILCPNETRDTTIVISNVGTVANTVHASAAGLTLGQIRIPLGINATGNLPIRFAGRAGEGAVDETVILTDSTCGMQRTVRLTGRIEAPKLSTGDVMLTGVVGGAAVEEILTIHNTSGRQVTIIALPDITPFEFVNVTAPLTIPANDSIRLHVRYAAPDTTTRQVTVMLDAEPCGAAMQAHITGRGNNTPLALATLATQRAEGYPGDEVEVPIVLDESINLAQSGASMLTATLRFNATLLDPIGITPRGTIIGGERVIPLELPTMPQSGDVLTTLRFRVMLGDDTLTTLRLENAGAVGGTVTVRAESSVFHLLGVCRDGGARLLNPNGQVAILKVRPNPMNESAEIEIETLEAGRTQLAVIDMLGREVETLYDGELASGRHSFVLITNRLADGSYHLLLTTPTVHRVYRVDIVK